MSKRIPDEDLINEIHRLADDEGPPTHTEMDNEGKYGTTTFTDRFGSWNDALRAAGYEPNSEQNISNKDLLQEVSRLADEIGEPPSYEDMEEKGNYSASTYQRRWDSWNAALRDAGYQPRELYDIPDSDLLNEIHRLAEAPDSPPSESEMINHGLYSATVYRDRWGSWNEAVREAGYFPNRATDISPAELKKEIDELADSSGAPPSRRDMAEEGKYSPSTYYNQWGSWNEAVQAAGYEPNQEQDIEKEALLDEIRRLNSELGRVPTFRDMDKHGKYSTMAYKYQFHSWWAAVVKSGCTPHNRYPLSPEGIHRFFKQATERQHQYPTQALIGLLLQFTGITAPIVTAVSDDWLSTPADDVILRIPEEHTNSQEFWEIQLPDTWQNPFTKEEESTQLPGLLQWYLNEYGRIKIDDSKSVRRIVYKIASESGLSEFRPTAKLPQVGIVPRVHPSDLRITHGVHLANNGAPPEIIQDRLGLQHTNTDIDTEEIFIWLEQEGYSV